MQSAVNRYDPKREALGRYNLHYFGVLCAAGAGARRAWHEALIARRIAEYPVCEGVGPDPYVGSVRHALSPAINYGHAEVT